ncbi:MAG TPA: hypothetical protein VKZ87_18415 [Ferrovibrio sp.]|uniref:hypothetical protein n=1 Tax=Ferrovibrio sp. TaxID=1917215 RepID=UPI002B4B8520|nr:hypothetical protein [Ferrovibrio sp.]HLT79366.1 hypothetical protein [Ferrovibrio sp.]
MDLPINPALPLGGIALILTLVWLTGGRRSLRIAATGEAAAALCAPEIGFDAREIVLSKDGQAALARDGEGRVAVVFVSGSHLAARKLDDIAAVTLLPQGGGAVRLEVKTRAFTRPDFALLLDASDAGVWQQYLREAA